MKLNIAIKALTSISATITIILFFKSCFFSKANKKNVFCQLVDENGNDLVEASIVYVYERPEIQDHAVTNGMTILFDVPLNQNRILTLDVICTDGRKGRTRIELDDFDFANEKTYHVTKAVVSFNGFQNNSVKAIVRTQGREGALIRANPSMNSPIITHLPEGTELSILFYYPDLQVIDNKNGRWCCVKYKNQVGCMFGTNLMKVD